jgi:tetratricopeptide repeat protein
MRCRRGSLGHLTKPRAGPSAGRRGHVAIGANWSDAHVEQALASDLKTYGEAHANVAIRRHNLSAVLRDIGDLPAALQLFEQALASDLKTYGEGHPNVAMRRRAVDVVLEELRRLLAR